MGSLTFYNRDTLFAPQLIRGAIDIGSGTTNLKVAKINPETNKIISIIFEKTVPVAYQKQLEQTKDGQFNSTTIEESINSIKQLKDFANQYHAEKIVAVATAAFRSAENGQFLANQIEEQTGVKVRIIDQDEEGVLAFKGAISLSPVEAENAVVWDIGGGSMQFTTLSPQESFLVEHGKLASIPFKNWIIENLKHQNSSDVVSPNPLSNLQVNEAVDYASSQAQLTSKFFRDKIQSDSTKVLAVGNLFNLGIQPMVDKKEMNQKELGKGILKLENVTDEQLGADKMAEVAVSNPILVLGYMKGLNIHEITFVKVNNADGALTYAPYWS